MSKKTEKDFDWVGLATALIVAVGTTVAKEVGKYLGEK